MNQVKTKKRILIVDDDDSVRLGFQEVFQEADYEVYVAAKAEEACALAKKHRPDAVILDYYLLNDLSGVDVCKFIKEQKTLKHTKTIMITGVLSKDQAQKMSHFGFDKILMKPVESQRLLEEVRALLVS